ncbi:MAG: patatin-like phospholipase family protein [Candidimonas sp.]|nr:MAG: patatin-like phospholipase family protein [Candidimonas sp.]
MAEGSSPVGLVLTGGGARAAYQVGVLAGVAEILDPLRSPTMGNPFPIICGSSAGAVNATALACRADTPHLAIDRLCNLWENLHTDMVYRSDARDLLRTGLRWLLMLAFGWAMPTSRNPRPRSLLNNAPLCRLLTATLNFRRLRNNIASGRLQALAITASGYTTGEHLTFYQSDDSIEPWHRTLRRAVPCAIGVEHLMASSSIPFVFPAQAVTFNGETEWCGDGSMRQLAPLSPAIHLGAERVFVIGTGHQDDTHPELRHIAPAYPSLAQIGGHALSNIFLDSLSMDIERLERINELLARVPSNGENAGSLRPVISFVATPSRSLDEIAMDNLEQMPRAARTLFKVLGVSSDSRGSGGGALISYLLFETGYTRALIALGRADILRRGEEVKAFFKETRE